jgi:hypothetical protein
MQLIVISLMTALLSWSIVWGLIKLFFIPRTPFTFFKFKWEAPIYTLTKEFNLQLILPQEKIPSQLAPLLPLIDARLDDFFRNKLAEKLPMISMFIGDKTIQQLKEVFMEELQLLFPELIEQFSEQLQAELTTQLQTTLTDQLSVRLLKATAPLRKLALLVGLLWGYFIYVILGLF